MTSRSKTNDAFAGCASNSRDSLGRLAYLTVVQWTNDGLGFTVWTPRSDGFGRSFSAHTIMESPINVDWSFHLPGACAFAKRIISQYKRLKRTLHGWDIHMVPGQQNLSSMLFLHCVVSLV